MTPPSPIVGIIANPASGRDLRRLTAHAGLHSSTDKASVVQRLLAAFGAHRHPPCVAAAGHDLASPPPCSGPARPAGARRPLAVPGIPRHAAAPERRGCRLAARRMVERGVALIAVLGGDGTHKAVAAEVGDVPLLALSTGTNNAFGAAGEAAGAGLAGGLCASNRVPPEIGLRRNKLLVRGPRRGLCEWALVDVAVSPQPFIGARAISRAENLAEVFVSFAEPHAIGLSALCGLWSPVSRRGLTAPGCACNPDARESLLVPLARACWWAAGSLPPATCIPAWPTRRACPAGPWRWTESARSSSTRHRPPEHHPRPFGPFRVDVPGHLAYAARHRLLAGQRTPMTP